IWISIPKRHIVVWDSIPSSNFARCNAKKMRDNMAVDIWKELVDQHLKENVDGDRFVGLYD
ncbi:unnamed protein product, partial [Brassica oleracea var. botrytis]